MPSPICCNALTIVGPSLRAFAAFARGSDDSEQGASVLCFDNFLPTPQEIRGDIAAEYKWRDDNWGDKWPAMDAQFKDEGWRLNYFFATAYAPPVKILAEMSKRFPDLCFIHAFDVKDLEFSACGGFLVRNGEVQDLVNQFEVER